MFYPSDPVAKTSLEPIVGNGLKKGQPGLYVNRIERLDFNLPTVWLNQILGQVRLGQMLGQVRSGQMLMEKLKLGQMLGQVRSNANGKA